MVDIVDNAPFDEGNDDGWAAMNTPAQPAMPAMQMQAQEQSAEDAFADASFPVEQAPITI